MCFFFAPVGFFCGKLFAFDPINVRGDINYTV